MREMDKDGILLCEIQGRIFEESCDKYKTSSPVFIRRFMNSALAADMDTEGFLERPFNEEDSFDLLDREFGPSSYGSVKYSPDILNWIGYLYRYWAYTYEEPSKRIFRIAGARELRDLYYAYHSLDTLNALQRIIEAKGLDADGNRYSIDEGVKYLREVRREVHAENY